MSENINTNRLSKTDSYVRPKQTYTDKLNNDKEAILDQINGYEQVIKIDTVDIGTHIKYFKTFKDGTKKFRIGGVLINKKGLPNYVILSGKGKTWPVSVKGTIFYRKLSNDELIDLYEEKLEKMEYKIKSLKTMIHKLQDDLKLKDKTIHKLKKSQVTRIDTNVFH